MLTMNLLYFSNYLIVHLYIALLVSLTAAYGLCKTHWFLACQVPALFYTTTHPAVTSGMLHRQYQQYANKSIEYICSRIMCSMILLAFQAQILEQFKFKIQNVFIKVCRSI